MKERPLIFDIVRNVVKDGPGIRTTVFFKGCNLSCPWCHNPESQEPGARMAFYPNRCRQCGSCVSACSAACSLENEKRLDRTLCTNCGLCAQACPSGALTLVGRYYEVQELVDLLMKDKPFYDASGGGVTLSGGEPTIHREYCVDLIRALKQRAVNVAIQTNGTFEWLPFSESILPELQLVMFDIKVADPVVHELLTGCDNRQILFNLRLLASLKPEALLVRVPMVPGFNFDQDNCRRLAGLFRSLGITRIALLPYHSDWTHKAEAIGRPIHKQVLHRSLTEAEEAAFKWFFAGIRLVDMEEYADWRQTKDG